MRMSADVSAKTVLHVVTSTAVTSAIVFSPTRERDGLVIASRQSAGARPVGSRTLVMERLFAWLSSPGSPLSLGTVQSWMG